MQYSALSDFPFVTICMHFADSTQDKPRDKRKHDHAAVHVSTLPHASVKRIMCMDPEVQRVSGDAVALMARVIIPFLDLLAEKSLSSARQVIRVPLAGSCCLWWLVLRWWR